MAGNRKGGRVYFAVDGVQYDAKGDWTHNIGKDKREAIVGADGTHGYSATPQVPKIEGAITDASDLALDKLVTLDGVTVTLEIANGKTIVLRDAWFAGEGDVGSGEGEIGVVFHGLSADEVR